MFPFDLAALPTLRTRQALLILDLQNDFASPGGALAIPDAEGLVARTVKLAKAFRESGTGDVIWIRSLFDGHRPLIAGADSGDRIITTDAPVIPKRPSSSRGRLTASSRHEQAVMEADEEAFLSFPPGNQKPECVRPGTKGFELVAKAQEAVDSSKDLVFTKTHYSALAAGQQLIQFLRGRFVTGIYMCGALTNISIFATALDAASQGYEITLIDDCCGYRSDMRHSNAVHRLMHLTGCEVTTADDAMSKWKPKVEGKPSQMVRGPEQTTDGSNAGKGDVEASEVKQETALISSVPAAYVDDFSHALRSSLEKLTLNHKKLRDVVSGDASQPQLEKTGPIQAQTVVEPKPETPRSPTIAVNPIATAGPGRLCDASHVDNAPLEVDPDLLVEPPSDDDSQKRRERVRIEAKMSSLSRAFNRRGPPRVLIPARSSLAVGSAARNAEAAKLRSRPSEPVLGQSDKMQEDGGMKSCASAPEMAADETDIFDLPLGIDDRPEPSPANQPTPPTTDELPASEPTTPRPTSTPPLCEGDTTLITNILPPTLATTAFDLLKTEVAWNRMSHQGGEVPRLVAVQGTIDAEGNYPIYRHPSDESPPLLPFSPTVAAIKSHVEAQIGHELNHALIQFYRSGQDYISEHSDKTLDIARESCICNVSLGAERTMVFRTKRLDKDPSRKESTISPPEDTSQGTKRQTQRTPLPHNSLLRMGLATNMRRLHAIRQDKRLASQKTPEELSFNGERISLTFRLISTYTDASQFLIWGQGATSKSRSSASKIINGQSDEAVSMLQAFGRENHSSDFDWEGNYGRGFDVVNITVSPRLFLSGDRTVNMRVMMMLGEMGIGFARGSTGTTGTGNEGAGIRFVDCDEGKSVVEGQVGIMLYLDAIYNKSDDKAEMARRYSRLMPAVGLLDVWKGVPVDSDGDGEAVEKLKSALKTWDGFASENEERGVVRELGVVDFALWPVLHSVKKFRPDVLDGMGALGRYYEGLRGSEGVVKALGERDES